jgi:hypothetical protein
MRDVLLHDCPDYRNRYRNPVVVRLVRDGIVGTGNAWRRLPRPQTGRPKLVVIIGGRA